MDERVGKGLDQLYQGYLQRRGWDRSFHEGPVDGDGNPVPWITYPAQSVLAQLVRPDFRVFEYGCGHSSLWWAARVKEVISVDHDEAWVKKVNEKKPDNLTVLARPRYYPHGEIPRHLMSAYDAISKVQPVSEKDGYNVACGLNCPDFLGYAATLLDWPESHFDIIVVDGMARAPCCHFAGAWVNPRGIVVVDNSDRWQYSAGFEALRDLGFGRIDFFGPTPALGYESCTSIFAKSMEPFKHVPPREKRRVDIDWPHAHTIRGSAERFTRFKWNATLDEGVALWHAGRRDAAVEKLTLGVEQAPGLIEGVRLLSDCLVQLNRTDEAIIVVQRAIAVDPAEPHHHSRLAELLSGVGKLTEAETSARHAIGRSPATDVFHRCLSQVLMTQGRMTEAEAEARAAIALDPLSPENLEHLGTLLGRTNQLDAAEAALRKAIGLSPRRLETHLGLSRVLRQQRKFDAAIEAARVARDLVPQHPWPHRELAAIFEETGRTEEAAASLRSGIEAAPRTLDMHVRLSDLLERLGRTEEAIETMQRWIALDPANVDAQVHLSQLLEQTGRPAEAEAIIRRLIEASPGTGKFHDYLSHLLDRRGDVDGAIQAGIRAMELNPDHPNFQLHLGTLLARRGETELAIQAVRRAVVLNPGEPAFHVHLGSLLTVAQRLDEAEVALEAALALAPDKPGIQQALERVRSSRATPLTQTAS